MIELANTKAKTKAQQIRDYIAKNPKATPTEVSEAMGVNRQYIYTVMYKTKLAAGVKSRRGAPLSRKGKKLGRPRKVTEASENLKKLMQEYKDKKTQEQVDKYWKSVGEFQKAALSPERIAELTAQAAKPKARMQSSADANKEDWKTLSVVSSNVSIKDKLPVQGELFDAVNHPAHYKVGGIETIDFIEAKKLNYNIGNVVKYLTRADHKGNRKQDLEKALWYLTREIDSLKKTA